MQLQNLLLAERRIALNIYYNQMEQLFWKKIEIEHKKSGRPPKIDENVNLTYLLDQNLYIYTDGVSPYNTKDMIQEEKQPEPTKAEGISFKIGPPKKAPQLETQDYVYFLDPSTYQWTMKKTSGKAPSRRTSSVTWYEAPLLFVYGGVTNGKTVSDMYILNTENLVWKRFFFLEGPPGRLHFGFSTQGMKKYLVGGASMPENLLLDDVWQLSFENVAWNTQSLELPGITWERLPCDNLPGMKGHCVLQVSDREILMYGGYNKQKQCLDLCYLLDVETYELSLLELKGACPGPRAFHQILIVKESLICLYGGYDCPEQQIKSATPISDLYLLNLQEGHWSKPVMGGYIPQSRSGFAISGNQNEQHGEILILGGRLTDGTIDQCLYVLHELDLENEEAWDIRNDAEKNKYETYREAIKENKNAQIPTLTLEYDEAERIILEQRRIIGERENELKAFQEANAKLEKQHDELQSKLDSKQLDLEIRLESLKSEITDYNQSTDNNDQIIQAILPLLAQEKKKRKLLQRKAFFLEDVFRKTEQFIIEVDKVYNRIGAEGLMESINEDIIVNIEQKKQEHRGNLMQFRANIEDSLKKEQQVKMQLKQNKQILPETYKAVYHHSLSNDDKQFLAKKLI